MSVNDTTTLETTTTTNSARFYAQNRITGKFFNGSAWSDEVPSKSFDAVELAFIKTVWMNVEPVEVETWESSCAEGWSIEWFR